METQAKAEAEPTITSTDLVLRSVIELREFGQVATRKSVAKATNLPLTTVDDRIKHLRAIGKVRLAGGHVHGCYEPTEDRMDDRSVSTTTMPNGRVKAEIGDHVVELTQREAASLGAQLWGISLQFRGVGA